MARPKGKKGKPVNLYLPEDVVSDASKMAFEDGISVSQYFTRLIRRRAAKRRALT